MILSVALLRNSYRLFVLTPRLRSIVKKVDGVGVSVYRDFKKRLLFFVGNYKPIVD